MKYFIPILLLSLMITSCGDAGSSTPDPSPSKPPVSIYQPRQVTGSLYLGEDRAPAQNYQIILLNHTRRTHFIHTTKTDGSYSIPISHFRRFEEYSLHIVDDNFRYIGPISFSGQSRFTYRGGEGEMLGNIYLYRSALGMVDLNESKLDVSPPTNFLGMSPNGALESFSPPELFSSIYVGSHLLIDNPTTLLNAFYLSSQNPTQYEKELSRWSAIRIGAKFAAPSNHTMHGGLVTNASHTIRSSKVKAFSNRDPLNQPSWQNQHFNLMIHQNEIQTIIYPQMIAHPQDFVTFDILYYSGDDADNIQKYDFLGYVGMPLSHPPKIVATSQGTSITVPIDYNDLTTDNGLTRPFCLDQGDIYLSIEPPKAFSQNTVSYEDFPTVRAKFQYYYRVDGQDILAEIETNPTNDPLLASDYPSGFTSPFTSTILPYATRTWNPHEQTLTFQFTSQGAMNTHVLRFYDAMFLRQISSYHNAIVSEIRVELSYEGPKHLTGTIIKFKTCL